MKVQESLELGFLLSQLLVLPVLVIPKGLPESRDDRATMLRDNNGKRAVLTLACQRVKSAT